MSSVRIKFRFLTVTALLLVSMLSYAQVSTSTGAIRGTVTDSTGAVIENAEVRLTNPSLGIDKVISTEKDGTFVFPLLQPTSGYQVDVVNPGYEQSISKGISVRVTEITVIGVKLSVGSVSQQVSVSADEQQINTTNATLGAVVGQRVLTSLPLATRNVFDLAATDAGVYSAFTSPAATVAQGGNAIYVSGQRATNNDYRLNGVESTNVQFHTLAAGAIPIPNPDAVQEFKTQTSLYDATSAYGSGGSISLVTRSGTNRYHGVVYDFIRNTVLNANDYFLKYAQANPAPGVAPTNKAPVMLQNQFGGSFGGPVPKVRNTFFFANYEAMRQKNGSTGSVSGLIPVLPATRDAASLAAAFGLPANRIDPVAVRLLNARGPLGGYLFPQVAGTPGTLALYSASGPVILNTNQVSSRIDHNFQIAGQDNRLAIAYFWQDGIYINPSGLSGSPGQAFDYPLGNKNLSISDVHTFNSRIINEAVFGFNWAKRDIEAYGKGVLLSDVGMTRYNASFFPTLPSFSFSDGSLGQFGYGGNIGRYQHTNTTDFHDTLSWTFNKHNLRLGFETIREQFNETPQASPGGSLAFNTVHANTVAGATNYAGNAARNLSIRDFLVGAPYTVSGNTGVQRFHLRDANYSGFAQDDYRVMRRLTLNLGFRYDHFGNPTETKNLFSNFDPSLLSASTRQFGGSGLRDGIVIPGVNGSPSTLGTNNGNYSPRVGFAYDVLGNAKLSLRGGFGLYFQTNNTMQTQLINNPPFYVTASQNNITPIFGLSDPFGVLNLPQPSAFPLFPKFLTQTGVNATTGAPVFANDGGVPVTLRGVSRNNRTPYAENWNLTAEYEFIPKWTLNVGYLGSNGVRQAAGLNLNNALLVNGNNPGRFGLTTNSSANRESRVPIAGLNTTGFVTIVNGAFSSYNALLVTVSHRLADNFFLKAAYTHAKSLDNFAASESTAAGGFSQPGNQYYLALNKGSSAQDIPHRLVVTYVWDLPKLHNHALDFVLGHWSLAGITTYQNGGVGTITQQIGATSLTGTSGYGLITGNLKNSGSPQSNFSAGRIQYLNSSSATTQPLLTAGSTISGTNPQFGPGNENYTVGTGGGRAIGYQTRGAFRGPLQYRWDATLSKNFPLRTLGESGNLEFRAESFKIFNNAIFDLPSSAAGSSTFGQITNTTDTTGRQFQFAVKVAF